MDININDIKQGQKIAIIGKSGSGISYLGFKITAQLSESKSVLYVMDLCDKGETLSDNFINLMYNINNSLVDVVILDKSFSNLNKEQTSYFAQQIKKTNITIVLISSTFFEIESVTKKLKFNDFIFGDGFHSEKIDFLSKLGLETGDNAHSPFGVNSDEDIQHFLKVNLSSKSLDKLSVQVEDNSESISLKPKIISREP